jgi:hypothetical protein
MDKEQPTCPMCGGKEFHNSVLYASFCKSPWGFPRVSPLNASCCLSCGALIPFINAEGLKKVRSWNAKAD